MLPIEKRIELRKAYRFRVLSLLAFMLALLVVLGLALLVPAYILTDIRRETVVERLKSMDTSELDTKVGSLNSIITDINTRLMVFKNPEETLVVSRDALLPVLAHTNSELKINSFLIERTPEGRFTITTSGVAGNRAALLSFERALRSTPSFSGVNVPISNFVRGSDILFSIEFTRE